MSANSVLPPFEGIARACRIEYFAGTTLNELSECHSRLPIANSLRRSSRAKTLLSLSRLDTSANSVLPPFEGSARAGRIEYFAGPTLNELSECHSRLPIAN